MIAALSVPLVVVLCCVVVARLGMVRRPGTERSLWVVLAMFTCATAAQIPPGRAAVEATLGGVGGPALVFFVCAVISSCAARSLIDNAEGSARPAPFPAGALVLPAVALVAVVASFLVDPAPHPLPATASSELVLRASYYSGDVEAVLRWSVWLAYLTWALIGNIRMTERLARAAEHLTPGRWSRGLGLGALGCRVGLGYVALKPFVVAAWIGGVGPRLVVLDQIADAFALLSIVLITAGATHDALAERTRAVAVGWRHLRTVLRLHPLWRVLRDAAPEHAAHFATLSPRQRRIRHVTEIRDRQLALRHYVDPAITRAALDAAYTVGYSGDEARVQAEAAVIEAARLAKADGARPAVLPVAGYEAGGSSDIDAEARWLERVARAHQHSGFVRRFSHEYAREAAAGVRGVRDRGASAA